MDGVRSAVKLYFEDQFGCSGDGWHIETDAEGRVTHRGNPVNETQYSKLCTSIKKRSKREDDIVQSLPWLYPEQQRMMAYLRSERAKREFTEPEREMFEAYMTLSFYCGTRTDEMKTLRWSALVMN